MRSLQLATIIAGAIMTLTSGPVSGSPGQPPIPGLPPLPAEGPAICKGQFLTPELGKAMLDYRLTQCTNKQQWLDYTADIRKRILAGADLVPMPKRCPLDTIIRPRRIHDGYSVENVAFQSVPGFYVTGILYRPTQGKGPFPVVLVTQGHSAVGCVGEGNQLMCATLARMGAITLTVDMFGVGESALMTGPDAHRNPLALTMQTWGNMRALDMVLGLPGVDPNRVAVTGASGGGTQCFLLTAFDDRVKVSVPVVMLSSWMFGGCPCESGKPIHRSKDHFTNNTEIAAMAAPRPMLVVSDGKDWTQHVPTIEFPFLQKVYGFYGADKNVENIHLPTEGHDYGPSKRQAMYRFLARQFGLDISAAQRSDGKLDESHVKVENTDDLHIFTRSDPLPEKACRSVEAIEKSLKQMQAK
jgi:hypothetical protein